MKKHFIVLLATTAIAASSQQTSALSLADVTQTVTAWAKEHKYAITKATIGLAGIWTLYNVVKQNPYRIALLIAGLIGAKQAHAYGLRELDVYKLQKEINRDAGSARIVNAVHDDILYVRNRLLPKIEDMRQDFNTYVVNIHTRNCKDDMPLLTIAQQQVDANIFDQLIECILQPIFPKIDERDAINKQLANLYAIHTKIRAVLFQLGWQIGNRTHGGTYVYAPHAPGGPLA